MNAYKIFVLLFLTSPSPRVERGNKVFWSVRPRQIGIYDFSLTWNLLSAGMNRMVHTAEFCYAGKDKELSHCSPIYGELVEPKVDTPNFPLQVVFQKLSEKFLDIKLDLMLYKKRVIFLNFFQSEAKGEKNWLDLSCWNIGNWFDPSGKGYGFKQKIFSGILGRFVEIRTYRTFGHLYGGESRGFFFQVWYS
ncbi:MAG: hypothetical protein AMJ89_03250 [candidate division Zixibacteria bacterium SM23_73]|nr:MAG: hypothetical protein AMJ89_03250 [candidate division Zixibacteria bacterium SM23_73]